MSNLKDLKDQEGLAKMLVDKFEGTIDSESNFELRNTDRIDIAQIKSEEYLTCKSIFFKYIGFVSIVSFVSSV